MGFPKHVNGGDCALGGRAKRVAPHRGRDKIRLEKTRDHSGTTAICPAVTVECIGIKSDAAVELTHEEGAIGFTEPFRDSTARRGKLQLPLVVL